MLHAIKYLLLRAKWTEYACHSFIRMSSLLSIVFIYAPHLFVCSLIFTSLSIFHFGFSWSRSSYLIHFVETSEFELLRIVFTIFCNNGQWIWKFTCKLWKQIRKEQQINKYICMKYMFPCHGMCRYLRTWCRNICYVCDILHNIHARTLACNSYPHSHATQPIHTCSLFEVAVSNVMGKYTISWSHSVSPLAHCRKITAFYGVLKCWLCSCMYHVLFVIDHKNSAFHFVNNEKKKHFCFAKFMAKCSDWLWVIEYESVTMLSGTKRFSLQFRTANKSCVRTYAIIDGNV